jgi:hypothetical protein
MPLTHPYRSLPGPRLRALWLASLMAAIAYSLMLRQQGAPLLALVPHGIIGLELPGTPERALQLMAALGEPGHAIATRQVRLDFVFVLLYPLAFSTSCALLAERLRGLAQRACAMMAWSVWAAAPFDAVENMALLRMLAGHTDTPWPQISTACASLKFALVIATALALLCGLLAWGWQRGRRASAPPDAG